jgi:PD-(D/E)XK nuclease family transposase
MQHRTFISFDWAIKKVLRNKENFTVLEGFLSELLGFDVIIKNLLESESNKENESDKYDRVDILVQTIKGELMLVEVQYDDEDDYFHRMVYGISKLITEYIAEGQKYGVIKKAFSINIMYFRLGQGQDYIYEYVGAFVGRKKKDILNPTNAQKNKYSIQSIADIFPKYYIVRVGNYKEDVIEEPIDEWVYFLKHSEIKGDFTAKGMEKAKEVLKYENMPDEQKKSYQRYIENQRIEMAVMDTAIDKGIRKKAIEVAKNALILGLKEEDIVTLTGLRLDEIAILAKGEILDKNED